MRANFMAVSMDSLPEPVKNTRASGMGPMARSFSASCSAGSVVNGSKHE
ncbi:MAG: hypothetical protein IPP16_15460 [Acidimicrobiaceae bacterium]|nr:hypothetical protein [Acidimicrobiaceae bacterium]